MPVEALPNSAAPTHPRVEDSPEHPFPTSVATRGETSGIDPYKIAEAVYGACIDQLQQSGELRKPSEITNLYDQEDHFDDLACLYKHTCLAMGLAWPPPPRDAGDLSE